MRLTLALFKTNAWRHKKAIWQAQSNRKIPESTVVAKLREKNITIYDANEVAALPKPPTICEYVDQGPVRPQIGTINHPDYKEDRIKVFKDENVLLEGIEQAKLLTNTVEPKMNILPKQLVDLIDVVSLPEQDQLVKKCIKGSFIYEAEQVKLPIKKDPLRPAWRFPRDYGISDKRRNYLICNKLLHLCEMVSHLSGNKVSEERLVLEDAHFSVPLKWNNSQLLFDLRADLLIASKSAFQPFSDPEQYKDIELPDLKPLLPTVSLEETNYYQLVDKFPMKSGPQDLQIHTAFVYYNETEVANIYGSPVEVSQIEGRSLLKAYTFAVAQARQNYGQQSTGPLPVPVTVQTIQTNGQWFHFNVMQLNTFDMDGGQIRNYFWSTPRMNLFSTCGYNEGRPELKNYNPEVFKTLLAFYNH